MGLLNIKARQEGTRVSRLPRHWVDPYVSIPFVDRGRSRLGADCYGWIRVVFGDLQPHIELPPYDLISAYDSTTVKAVIDSESAKEDRGRPLWSPVRAQNVRPFDLVVMRGYYVGEDKRWHSTDCHLGLAVDGLHVIHMEDNKGVIKQRLDDGNVRPRIMAIWRHKDIRPVDA